MMGREQAIRVAEALRQAAEYPRALKPAAKPGITIALSREAGAGGEEVAAELGRRLNWPVYDHELLAELSRRLQVGVHYLQGVDERPGSRLMELVTAFAGGGGLTEERYFRNLMKLILALGGRGECLIVGRGAMIALPTETTLRVRVTAEREQRVAAVAGELRIGLAEAGEYVDRTDGERSRFIRSHFHRDLTDVLLYDLVLNSTRFRIGECADLVLEALLRLRGRAVGN
jgi:cytidylate kinase